MASGSRPIDPYMVAFGPKANCTFELCDLTVQSVYRYRPSLPANIIFAAIFTLATAVHIHLGLRWKTPGVMWCMILSCTHEVAGYIARVLLWVNPWSFGAFITQVIAITQAPVFYCAVIYVLLGQCINFYAPTLARFPTKYFAWVFVPCDVISLVLQGSGGGLSSATSGKSRAGVDIAMAGLILQCITLTAFSVLFADFMYRLLRSTHAKDLIRRDAMFLSFLVLAVLCTFARCIFRAYELKDGYIGSELITHEDWFIGLEGVLVVVAIFAMCIGHPGYAFKGRKGMADYKGVATTTENVVFLDKSNTSYQGSGYEESRQ